MRTEDEKVLMYLPKETLNIFLNKVDDIEKYGCSNGKVQDQKINDISRRVNDLETKFWAIIVLLLTNLAATLGRFIVH